MARCKLTRMSLRNIRKDKQYQCIVIDFVRTGVISKSKAEELLNYTIPAGLLEGSVAAPDDDEDEPGTGGEGTGGETAESVTLAVNLGDIAANNPSSPKGGAKSGGTRDTEATSSNQPESDGWLLVNFPLPEDPEDRWLVIAPEGRGQPSYNTELLGAMYDTIKDAVVATGDFTAEDFEAYFAPFNSENPVLPYFVTASEDYQIGEDAWSNRFTVTEEPPAELTDGMILSYTHSTTVNSGELVNM